MLGCLWVLKTLFIGIKLAREFVESEMEMAFYFLIQVIIGENFLILVITLYFKGPVSYEPVF